MNPHLARHLCNHPESGEDIVTPRVVRLQYQTRQTIRAAQNEPLRGASPPATLLYRLMFPSADPAGAKPRRDHRFLDRRSRHEVPKTPRKKTQVKIYDPAGCRTYQSFNQCDTLAGSRDRLQRPIHRSSGLKSGHPYRGASFSTIHNELNGFYTSQMRHPDNSTPTAGFL